MHGQSVPQQLDPMLQFVMEGFQDACLYFLVLIFPGIRHRYLLFTLVESCVENFKYFSAGRRVGIDNALPQGPATRVEHPLLLGNKCACLRQKCLCRTVCRASLAHA